MIASHLRSVSARMTLVTLMGSVAAAALASPAWAQTAARDSEVDEVVVTGSLLRVPQSQQSQLVTIVGQDSLEKQGASIGIEALQTISQNQTLTNTTQSFGAGTGFATYANLRSLGPSNTLVLFNGKRLAVNPYQSIGVDLNTIPFNMIERVETLADGASSVYGSDAIAGVINYITRKELRGLSVSLTGSWPEEPGGEKQNASIAGGVGSLEKDGWNIYAGYTYYKKRRLAMYNRDFSDTAFIPERGFNRLQPRPYIANWNQASVANNAPQNPLAPACLPPESPYYNGAGGVNACTFDLAKTTEAIPPETDQSFIVHGTAKLAQNHTATLEYLRARTKVVSSIAPTSEQNVPMRSSNVFYPGGGITPGAPGINPANPVTLNWRVAPLGLLAVKPITETDRILGELEGEFGGWRYDVFALRSTSQLDYHLVNGWVDDVQLRAAILGDNVGGVPDINPFGPQTAAGAAFLDAIEITGKVQTAKTKLSQVGGQISGDIFQLPAGAVQLAIAADYKEETAEFRTQPDAVRSTFAALLTSIDGRRESYGLVAETRIPLFAGFDVDASIRYDHYSDFGSTVNPKVLATWRVSDMLSLRASYNEGFRAPTLHNVFSPVNLADTRARFRDPVLCAGGVVNTAMGGDATRDCGGVYRVLGGGNANLGPETSKAFTVGLQFRPWSNVQLGVDYWRYHISGTISPVAESAIFGNVAQFGDLIVRCSQADPALLPNIPLCRTPRTGDPIAYVVQTNQNLGDTKTDGVDITFRWAIGEFDFGRLAFEYRSTVVLNYDYQLLPNGPFQDRAGVYRDNFPVIDYSHYATLAWTRGPWTAQLSNRFLNDYVDCNLACPAPATPALPPRFNNSVHSYSLWDLAVTWDAPHDVRITARVTNLLDEDPPFTNRNQGLATGWDERFVDPIGRAFSLTVRYEF
jgi:iron complex outermembrane recepter protein